MLYAGSQPPVTQGRIGALLSACELFSVLPSAEVTELALMAVPGHVRAGAEIFHEGERAEHVYILESGIVRIEASQPVTFELSLASAGDVLGWSALVEPMLHLGTAVAVSDVRALQFTGADVLQFIARRPEAGRDIMTAVARHARTQLWALLRQRESLPASRTSPLS